MRDALSAPPRCYVLDPLRAEERLGGEQQTLRGIRRAATRAQPRMYKDTEVRTKQKNLLKGANYICDVETPSGNRMFHRFETYTEEVPSRHLQPFVRWKGWHVFLPMVLYNLAKRGFGCKENLVASLHPSDHDDNGLRLDPPKAARAHRENRHTSKRMAHSSRNLLEREQTC